VIAQFLSDHASYRPGPWLNASGALRPSLFEKCRKEARTDRRAGASIYSAEASSPWIETRRFPRFPACVGRWCQRIAVVGAESTGITAATLLRRRTRPCSHRWAARCRRGHRPYEAHLTEGARLPFSTSLLSTSARRRPLGAGGPARRAETRFARLVQEKRIGCGFQRLPGFYFTRAQDGVDDVQQEIEAARRLGSEVSFTTDVPCPSGEAALRIQNRLGSTCGVPSAPPESIAGDAAPSSRTRAC